MLSDYPVDYGSPEVKAALAVLETIYRVSDIERVVLDARIRPGEVRWNDRPALTWRSVFDLAAGDRRLEALFDAVSEVQPVLGSRLRELQPPEGPPVLPLDRDGTAAHWKNFSERGAQEAVIVEGQPTFLDVEFLATGYTKAKSVCRISTVFAKRRGLATGFRIGPRLILTNHHVLFDEKDGDARARSVEAWFNYQKDADGSLRMNEVTTLRCEPESIVGEKEHDWAVVSTSGPIPPAFPILPLAGSTVPAVDDRVNIIQHPEGLPKMVAFQHNLVRSVDDDTIQYWTDTNLGSSGSPVFDESWSVVALHHLAAEAPAGERTNVRNQGRRIDRVVQRMRGLGAY